MMIFQMGKLTLHLLPPAMCTHLEVAPECKEEAQRSQRAAPCSCETAGLSS
jgi:hypothetical protein